MGVNQKVEDDYHNLIDELTVDDEVNKKTNESNLFDVSGLNSFSFIEGLNKCQSKEELVRYVDGIVSGFSNEESPRIIGTTGNMFSKTSYSNNGKYDGFIKPSTKISNASIGFSYRIYDRNYLYDFAYRLRKLRLSKDTCILPYVMKYLDFYFGFPEDHKDRRDDALYAFAVAHAEEFYKKYNIPVNEEIGAVDQMQISGEFPLSALKGTYSAMCVERAALAQNIMKMCGFSTSIVYGECESLGEAGWHCWNMLTDKNDNTCILDFSDTVHSFHNGKFTHREPYFYPVNKVDNVSQDGIIILPDYHYEDGRRVAEDKPRKYAIGKSLNLHEEIEKGNKL